MPQTDTITGKFQTWSPHQYSFTLYIYTVYIILINEYEYDKACNGAVIDDIEGQNSIPCCFRRSHVSLNHLHSFSSIAGEKTLYVQSSPRIQVKVTLSHPCHTQTNFNPIKPCLSYAQIQRMGQLPTKHLCFTELVTVFICKDENKKKTETSTRATVVEQPNVEFPFWSGSLLFSYFNSHVRTPILKEYLLCRQSWLEEAAQIWGHQDDHHASSRVRNSS